jgi:hypothetical protein
MVLLLAGLLTQTSLRPAVNGSGVELALFATLPMMFPFGTGLSRASTALPCAGGAGVCIATSRLWPNPVHRRTCGCGTYPFGRIGVA